MVRIGNQAQKSKEATIPDWVFDIGACDAPDRKFWITKGLGAGGTYGLAIWHIARCFRNAKSPFSWCLGPTYQQVADTLLPTFAQVLTDVFNMSEEVHYRIVPSGRPRIELLRTKQTIHFRSTNRPERLVGANISHASGTEPGLWPREAFEKTEARIRCPRAEIHQVLFEGTPEGLGNPYEEMANFPEGVDEGRNAQRIILHTEHNPVLKPGYVTKLQRTYAYDPAKLEAYLYGRFTSFSRGSGYWEFRDSRNVRADLQAAKSAPLLFCWDFNRSPLAWCVMQRQVVANRWNTWHRFSVVAESSGRSRGVLDGVAEFIAKFPPHTWGDVRIEVYGDPSGYAGSHMSPSCAYDLIQQALQRRYHEVVIAAARSAPSIKDRLERHNALLAFGRIVIDSRCVNTIKSHTQTNLKKGMWQIEKPQGEDWTHYADALGYPLYQLTKGENLENEEQEEVLGITI